MKSARALARGCAVVLIALAAVGCSSYDNSTPTKAFQTLDKAVRNRDVAAFKSVLPKSYLEVVEKAAKERNITVDAKLNELLADPLWDATPEVKDEIIEADGKSATVQIKKPKRSNWSPMRFVKEDDGWKVHMGP